MKYPAFSRGDIYYKKRNFLKDIDYFKKLYYNGKNKANLLTQLAHIMPSGLIPTVFSWKMKLLQTNSIGSVVVASATALLNPVGDTLRSIYKYIKSFV